MTWPLTGVVVMAACTVGAMMLAAALWYMDQED